MDFSNPQLQQTAHGGDGLLVLVLALFLGPFMTSGFWRRTRFPSLQLILLDLVDGRDTSGIVAERLWCCDFFFFFFFGGGSFDPISASASAPPRCECAPTIQPRFLLMQHP
jgi:hypothetical protein